MLHIQNFFTIKCRGVKKLKLINKWKETVRSKLWVKILNYVLIPFYSVFCLATMEYMNYSSLSKVSSFWEEHPKRFQFSLIIIFTLTVFLLLICRKLWIYATTLGSLSVILGIINYVKFASNGDNFVPWDITMMGNMGELVGFANFNMPPLIYLSISIVVIMSLAFWFMGAEIPVKWYIRLPAALLITVPFIILYQYPKKTEKILNKYTMSFNDSILQSSNYRANGFVNAFTINCYAMKVVAPEGYGADKIEEYLEGYTESTPTEQTPDVIVIMSEAFTDIRKLNGTTFSIDPLQNYDEIASRENAISGDIYTTANGGGTVRTEFEALTGLTIDYLVNGTSPYLYVTKELETCVSNFRDQGYKTTGIHSYMGKFYMRDRAYPLLGFDEFITETEIYNNYYTTYRRGYIKDDVFMDAVIGTLENNTDKPNFIFGITMENHGGYDKSKPEDIIVEVTNDKLEQATLDAVTTYTQGVYYADLSLKKLIDYVDSREKPTIVMFFGDHKPSLGAYQAPYNQAGNVYIGDGYDHEECKEVYSAQYVMYANYDVDYGVIEENKNFSAYYMMPLIAKTTGTSLSPYMQYLYDHFEKYPYYNVRLNMKLDEEHAEFIESMKMFTYDRVKGKKYSEQK